MSVWICVCVDVCVCVCVCVGALDTNGLSNHDSC